MTTTIQNNEFWQTKLLARIHDPAEKALVLMNTTEGHEGGTVADLKKEFFNQAQISKLYPIVQKADHWAAAADRPTLPLTLPLTLTLILALTRTLILK